MIQSESAPVAQGIEHGASNAGVACSNQAGGASLATTLRLSSGKIALIDLEDLERASVFKWSACWINSGWYGKSWAGGKQIYLHRFIMNAVRGELVDHRSGDTLDCRKKNLRKTGTLGNCLNRRACLKNKSGHKGVIVRGDRFEARIKLGGISHYLGRFDEVEAAARAYDDAAIELHGEFARLNFPAPHPEPQPEREGAGK